jgi:type I restriction enzyme S subunit
LKEQKTIAKALSDVDELIVALEKLIAKKRDIKTATMQQLLTGKKRLPGFGEGKSYKQTELGEIPEDWNITTVSQITKSHKQGYYTKDRYVNIGVRLVRITDLYNPKIDYESMPLLAITENDFNQYKIQKGDFLFARSGAIGRYGIVEDNIDAIFGSYIIRFNFDEKTLLNSYFGYLFETNLIWRQLLSITQGSSNININASNIKSLQISIPDFKEQIAISKVLTDMDLELIGLTNCLNKTQSIKQGMMQELLTGRTRLISGKLTVES